MCDSMLIGCSVVLWLLWTILSTVIVLMDAPGVGGHIKGSWAAAPQLGPGTELRWGQGVKKPTNLFGETHKYLRLCCGYCGPFYQL